jgi:hypothetical protein
MCLRAFRGSIVYPAMAAGYVARHRPHARPRDVAPNLPNHRSVRWLNENCHRDRACSRLAQQSSILTSVHLWRLKNKKEKIDDLWYSSNFALRDNVIMIVNVALIVTSPGPALPCRCRQRESW